MNESIWEKILVGIMFVMVMMAAAFLPDFLIIR
jgi:hypothetical protein